jgi:hypothetical protein
MKKIIYTFAFLLIGISPVWSQKEIKVTATTSNGAILDVPSFSFTEPIKLVVDVSGVPVLVGKEPLYIWAFIQGCCSAPNGDWGNSNEANRMTKEGPNLWSIIIPSVKSFVGASYKQARDAAETNGRSADQTRFGFLVKAKDGNGDIKSGDIDIPFTGPIYIKEKLETFPINPAASDVLTIVYNQDKEDVEEMKTVTDVYLYATATLASGGTKEPFTQEEVGTTAALKLKKEGTKYTITIIPNQFFSIEADEEITQINVLIQGTEAEVNFGNAKAVKIVTVK